MDKLEVIKACLTLISYVRLKDATGADFVIDTAEGTVHFTYDFTGGNGDHFLPPLG